MGTMAPGMIFLLLCSAFSNTFAATRPPILDLTEELLRDIEKAQAQTARGEEVEKKYFKSSTESWNSPIMIKTDASQDLSQEEHLVQHLAGFTHGHQHEEYDGHRHTKVDHVDHRLQQHHHDDQHQHQDEEVNHQHIEHQHEHQDGTKHAHLLPIYDSIKNEQVARNLVGAVFQVPPLRCIAMDRF